MRTVKCLCEKERLEIRYCLVTSVASYLSEYQFPLKVSKIRAASRENILFAYTKT